jgi:hypothetical protein
MPSAVSSPSVIGRFEGPPKMSGIPLQVGPISLRPHLLYRFLYGDGIQSQPGESEKTVIQEVSPGILLGLGNRWTLDYTPRLSFYSSSEFRDTLGHNVILSGNLPYENWMFGLAQIYDASSDPLIETATQTDQEIHSTRLSASYFFNDEMWLELGVNQDFRFAEISTHSLDTNGLTNLLIEPQGSREWSTMDWLNYRFFPGFDSAIGAGFGYVDMESGLNMTYEQVQARARWHAMEKISFSINGGVEFRQFLDSTNNGVVNPIFGASVEYHPFDHTTLSISGNRRVSVSYFTNEIIETTGFQISLDQRLLEILNLNLTYGYGTTRFVTASETSDREDESSSFGARISCPIRQRLTLAVFYNFSENSSSDSDFAFSSSQVGLEARYQY